MGGPYKMIMCVYDVTEFDVLTKFSVTSLILVIERSALAIWKWEINPISTISYDLTKFDVLTKFSVTSCTHPHSDMNKCAVAEARRRAAGTS